MRILEHQDYQGAPISSTPVSYTHLDVYKRQELRFAYDETDDQLQSAAEIKADMERPSPMDRLLCGDVGLSLIHI